MEPRFHYAQERSAEMILHFLKHGTFVHDLHRRTNVFALALAAVVKVGCLVRTPRGVCE